MLSRAAINIASKNKTNLKVQNRAFINTFTKHFKNTIMSFKREKKRSPDHSVFVLCYLQVRMIKQKNTSVL